MNRSASIAGLLAVLALGVAAMAWRSAGHDTRERPVELDLVLADTRRAAPVADDALELPLPESPRAEGAADEPADQRRAVERPRPPDFEAKYASWPRATLVHRAPELEKLIERAKSARFEQLHAHFDELLASNRYGARVTGLDQAFVGVPVDLECPRDVSARTVELSDGTYAMHVLEFSRAEEPATAGLVAELAFVKSRLAR
jgi:hypothetical protein